MGNPRQLEQARRSRGLRIRQARLWHAARIGRSYSQTLLAQDLTTYMDRAGSFRRAQAHDQSRVARWENGRQEPTLDEYEALEAVLGVPAAWLAFNVPLELLAAERYATLVKSLDTGTPWRPKASQRKTAG